MRRWRMATLGVLGAICLAAGGCGSSTAASPPATAAASGPDTTTATTAHATTTTTLPPGPTSKQLTSELLSVSDLPTGWVSEPVSKSSGGTSGCSLKQAVHQNATGSAEADFADGSLPVMDEILAGYRTAPGAAFSRVVKELGQCRSLNDQGRKLTMGRMSFPAIGDASAAYEATGTIKGFNFGVDFVFVRKGAQVMLMLYGDIGTPDATQLAGFAKKAVAKLPA